MTQRFFAMIVCVLAGNIATAQDKKPAIRVACIGDSITYGAGVQDRPKNSYPAVLQTLLGDGYEVKNFGVSGRTLLNKGDYPYTKEKAYRDALAFQPNIVIIKLGTNDSKPQNWKFADQYEADYKSLIESFQKLDSKPKVYLCLPVPAFKGNFGITEKVVAGEVKPKVEAVAKELKLPVIDLYTVLKDKPELVPDQIHPNAAGAKIMAETIAKTLKGE